MIWNPGEDIQNSPGVGDLADHTATAARCMAIAAGRDPAAAGNTAAAAGRNPAAPGGMAVAAGRNPAAAGNMAVAAERNPAAAGRMPVPAERNPAAHDPGGEQKIPARKMNRQFFDERRSRGKNEIPRQLVYRIDNKTSLYFPPKNT